MFHCFLHLLAFFVYFLFLFLNYFLLGSQTTTLSLRSAPSWNCRKMSTNMSIGGAAPRESPSSNARAALQCCFETWCLRNAGRFTHLLRGDPTPARAQTTHVQPRTLLIGRTRLFRMHLTTQPFRSTIVVLYNSGENQNS